MPETPEAALPLTGEATAEPGLFEMVITDPLVVAWRAFSDRFMDPEYRNDPERMHIRDAFAAGWDAALRAARGAGLDVERLARAEHASYEREDGATRIEWADLTPNEKSMWRRHAERRAREYAALAPHSPATEEGWDPRPVGGDRG